MNPHDTTWQFWSDLIMLIKPFKTISTRGAYYQAESAGLVDKTDSGYNKVQRALSDMRREGLIPYSKVRDTTRARRKDWMVSTMGEAAESTLRSYRHDYWDIQPFHVEVWCEKEALSPQIEPICEEFGVFYGSTR